MESLKVKLNMNNPLFSKLLSFCKLERSNIPLEDFTTEILAGVLRSDQELLDMFINEVLKIEGNGFELHTQKQYGDVNSNLSYIDMVFSNKDTLCFMENKVASYENPDQLEKYVRILLIENKIPIENIHLRYCTKNKDIKSQGNHNSLSKVDFKQFRWRDIYNFLEKSKSQRSIIDPFLTYLSGNNMKSVNEFTIQDVFVINHVKDVLEKINVSLDDVEGYFYSKLSEVGKKHNKSSALIFDNILTAGKRLEYKDKVLPSLTNIYSDIHLGYRFTDSKYLDYPVIFIQVRCLKNHEKYNILIDNLEKYKNNHDNRDKFELLITSDDEAIGCFEAPLSDFISSNNQSNDINLWFKDAINLIAKFIEETPELNWNRKI